jgi:autotransporter-associated beta strand protein
VKNRRNPFLRHSLSLAIALGAACSAHAADGTWNVDADGLWSADTNWLGNVIANDLTSTANFTNNITADRTVHLNSDRTLNKLVFSDSNTATTGSWILDNNGSSTNNLILSGTTGAATGTAPVIEVGSLGSGNTATISAIIEGSYGFAKVGVGTLVLSAANTYSGGTSLQADTGIVQITDAAGFGTGTVTVRPGGTSGAARLNFAVPVTGVGSSANDPNIIGNAFNLGGQGSTLAGGGFGAIQNVSGFNKITGNITRSNTGGTSYNIVSDANTLELSGTLSNTVSNTRAFNFGGAGDIVVTGAITNGSTGATAVAKDGAGNLTLTGNKAFTGGLTVRAGAVYARSSGGALGNGAVTLGNTSGNDAVTLLLATSSTFNNAITVAAGSNGSVTINNFANYSPTLAGSITLNKDLILRNTNGSGGNNLTVSGTVGGTGGLQINSTHANNTVTFSGTGNQSGTTSVNGGILVLDGSFTSASNIVTVASGAKLAGTGTIAGATTIQSGGRYSPGEVGAAGNQNFSDKLTFDSGSIFDWDLTTASNSSGFDTVTGTVGKTFTAAGAFRVVTDLDFSAAPFWDSTQTWSAIFNSFGSATGWASATAAAVYSTTGTLRDVGEFGSFSITGSTLTWAAVPEPTSALAGLLMMFGLLRRRARTTP